MICHMGSHVPRMISQPNSFCLGEEVAGGTDVELHTDHKPLAYLLKKSDSSPQLGRWLIELQNYQIKIVHIAGKQNSLADALSRAMEDKPFKEVQNVEELEDIVEFPDGNSYEVDLAEELSKDPEAEAYIKEFCALLYINKKYATPHWSQGNAATERTFRTFHNIMAKYITRDQPDFDEFLDAACFCYNTSVHASTGESPFFLMFGRDPIFCVDQIIDPKIRDPVALSDRTEFKQKLVVALRRAWSAASEVHKQAQLKMKEQYDKKARPQGIQIAIPVEEQAALEEIDTDANNKRIGGAKHVENEQACGPEAIENEVENENEALVENSDNGPRYNLRPRVKRW
uniref:Integrase catalytic domain-containing protein n=1 Tax=Globodera pallida TaxID=36090 RepID=A0A183CCQ3_GLOPA